MVQQGAGLMAGKSDAHVYSGDNETGSIELAGRAVEVRTIRSLIKLTPNEDAALVMPVGDDALVLAVADGLGGSPAGGEAARLVVETLARALSGPEVATDTLRTTILDAIEAANRTLIEMGRRGTTTLVVAEIVGRQLRSYHIGDSELLVFGQRGRIRMRIVPHSPTGFAIEAGLLDEKEAMRHEERHVVFNVVGAPSMSIDISAPIRLAARDTVLLASDGLLDNLFAEEIVSIAQSGPLPDAMSRLVATSLERMLMLTGDHPGKPDDLTIVLCREKSPRRAGRKA